MRKKFWFNTAVTGNALVIMMVSAVAMMAGMYSNPASAQECRTDNESGPWFISANNTETAPSDKVQAAALMAVAVCPGKVVLCAGKASAGKEDHFKNPEYAKNREKQCFAAIGDAGGTAVLNGFLGLGAAGDCGRGVYMSCASGPAGPPGRDGKDGRDGIGRDGKDGRDASGEAWKQVFRPNVRLVLGYLTVPSFSRLSLGNWGIGVGLDLPDLSEKFGLRGSYDFGMVFRETCFLFNSHVEVGWLLGPWGRNGLFSFHMSYGFDLGQTDDFTRTKFMGHSGVIGLIFKVDPHLFIILDGVGGKAWTIGTESHVATCEDPDEGQCRITNVNRFKDWMFGVKAGLVIPFW